MQLENVTASALLGRTASSSVTGMRLPLSRGSLTTPTTTLSRLVLRRVRVDIFTVQLQERVQADLLNAYQQAARIWVDVRRLLHLPPSLKLEWLDRKEQVVV